MREYHEICANGAKELENLLRETAMAESVKVFALHGASNGPQGYGKIIALLDSAGDPPQDMAPHGFTHVTPLRSDAWEGVPYDALHTVLFEACRRVPLF